MSYHHFVKSLHRHRSRISREWKRHLKEGSYSPRNAQESYHMAKSHCGRKRMLERDHNKLVPIFCKRYTKRIN